MHSRSHTHSITHARVCTHLPHTRTPHSNHPIMHFVSQFMMMFTNIILSVVTTLDSHGALLLFMTSPYVEYPVCHPVQEFIHFKVYSKCTQNVINYIIPAGAKCSSSPLRALRLLPSTYLTAKTSPCLIRHVWNTISSSRLARLSWDRSSTLRTYSLPPCKGCLDISSSLKTYSRTLAKPA